MGRIVTARLVLRAAGEPDRDGLVELQCDPLVRAHLGGVRSRAEAEARLPADPSEVRPVPEASYVIASRGTDRLMGTVSLHRRGPERPGHIRPGGNELELSYMLLPRFWGRGYAEEAPCRRWAPRS